MPAPSPTRLLMGAILIVTVSTQPVFLLGAAFLQIGDDLGFGPVGLGVLTSLFFLSASLASAPLGRVVEWIGWQRSMRLNALATAVVSLGIALVADGVISLAVLLVVGGTVYGLANPAANQSLAQHVDPHRRGVVFGLKHAGIPSSTLIAGLALPLIILRFDWRAAFIGAAVLALLVAVGVPRGDLPATAARFDSDPRREVPPMSSRLLSALAGVSALASWGAIALSTYLVAAAVDVGFSESAAGWLLFAGSASSIIARIVAGAITDRIGGRGFRGIALLTGGGAVVFAVLTAASGATFAALVIVAFATGWGWPGLMTYAVVNANSGSAAASSAITQAGIFLGAGVGPVVIGRIVDAASFDVAWLVVAGALAVAAAGVAYVGRRAVGPLHGSALSR